MKFIIYCLIFAIAVIFCSCNKEKLHVNVESAQTFQTSFGGTENDFGQAIKQTPDGGYIIAGYTYSFSSGDSDAYAVKISSDGQKEWEESYGQIGNNETFLDVVLTPEGDYIFVGHDWVNNFGVSSVYLVKVNKQENGTMEWQKTVVSNKGAIGNAIIKSNNDEGYIIVGTNFLAGIPTPPHLMIWEIDLNGDFVNKVSATSDVQNEGYDIISVDNGYVVVGGIWNSANPEKDIFLLKFNNNLDIEWTTSYGGDIEDDFISSLCALSDGSIILSGATKNYLEPLSDHEITVMKTNSTGAQDWVKILGDSYKGFGNGVFPTQEGGFVIAGVIADPDSNVYFGKFDAMGNGLAKSIGNMATEEAKSIIQTRDGGFAIVGYTKENFSVQKADVLVLKTDEEGNE